MLAFGVFLFDLAGGREAERAMRNKVIMFLCRCGSHCEAIKVNRADRLLSLQWFNTYQTNTQAHVQL